MEHALLTLSLSRRLRHRFVLVTSWRCQPYGCLVFFWQCLTTNHFHLGNLSGERVWEGFTVVQLQFCAETREFSLRQ